MVKHKQNIIINCDIEKVWSFLINLSRSLIFDKFHTLIELPGKYSINENYVFNVNSKYFFKKHKLEAIITQCSAPSIFKIKFSNEKIKLYKIFRLSIINQKTEMQYIFNGDFGNSIKNLSISKIIKLSCLNELRYIKKAIEASEYHIIDKKINTVTNYK